MQEDIWIAHTELAVAPGHPSYRRLNELLEGVGFDELVEGLCARFYHARLGRPSLRPGIYFRALLIGYFEGIIASEGSHGGWPIRWRYDGFWGLDWTSKPLITRRSRGPGA